MTLTRRDLLKGGAALLASHSLARLPTAQLQGPIRMVVGFPPGGSGDLFARIIVGHCAKSSAFQ